MKDTLGNDIKQKKYKTVQCALIESVQAKICRIDGDIEVIQMNPIWFEERSYWSSVKF